MIVNLDLTFIAAIVMFIVLTAIIYKVIRGIPRFAEPVKSALNPSTFPSCVLSVCVSALCVIGMNHSLKGLPGTVLLPYAVLGIAILSVVLVSFFYRCLNKRRERSPSQMDKKERIRIDNRSIRKQLYKRKGHLR